MRKTIATLFSMLLALTLASCSDFSPKEVAGFKFTGDGIFGNIPYMFAQNAQLTKDGTPEEDFSKYEKELKKNETIEVDCDVVKGESVSKGKLTFKQESDCYVSGDGSFVKYEATLSDDVVAQFEDKAYIRIVGLDKNGVIVFDYGYFGTYKLGGDYSGAGLKSMMHGDRNFKRYVKKLYEFDRVEKIVVTNTDGLSSLREKSVEAQMKNLTDEQKKAGKGDLAMFELRGNVKTLLVRSQYENMRYEFDEDGKLVSVNGTPAESYYENLKRDAEGRIASYTEGEYDMVADYKLVYGKNGFVEKKVMSDMGERTTTFTYNDANYLTSDQTLGEYTEMGADKPEKVDLKSSYKYTSVDENGNWLVRQLTVSEEGAAPYDEYRQITYYE